MTAYTKTAADGSGAADRNHAVRRTVAGPTVPVVLDLSDGGYRLSGTKATTVATSTG